MLRFIVLFYKLMARPSTRKKFKTCFIAILLYYHGLKQNFQYLQGMPVLSINNRLNILLLILWGGGFSPEENGWEARLMGFVLNTMEKKKGNSTKYWFFFLGISYFISALFFFKTLLQNHLGFRTWDKCNWIENIRNLQILQTCFDCLLYIRHCQTLRELLKSHILPVSTMKVLTKLRKKDR